MREKSFTFVKILYKIVVMEKLKQFLSSIIYINEKDWEYIQDVSTISSHKKGENLNFLTNHPRKIAFIISGIVRSFIIEENGKDFTWNFHYFTENSLVNNLFVVDYQSLLKDEDSSLHFEVLQNCKIIIIEYAILQQLYKTETKWQEYGRKVTEEAYIIARTRAMILLSKSALERLKILKKEFPDIFTQVPDYHIATYLGISPQTLSRLKKEHDI